MPPEPPVVDVVAAGEVEVEPAAPVTPAAAAADRAVGRTAVQVGVPTCVVIIGSWLARLFDLDLDPDTAAGAENMPPEVVAAWIGLVTWLIARRMNPKP